MWTSTLLMAVVSIISQRVSYISASDVPDDATLNSIGLATKYGHAPTQYDVVTEDGYILALYRLAGGSSKPVLLVHGLMDSSDTFLVRGNTSIAIVLANKGYDVWLLNVRGNRYSRRHQTLDPDNDPEYWQFSYQEKAYYDLPAAIDTILNVTNATDLTAIGHSEGNTDFFVLGAERPEYNSKINVLIALAPMAYTQNIPSPAQIVVQLESVVKELAKTLNIYELLGDNTTLGIISHTVSSIPVLGYTVAAYGLLFPLVGSDPTELEEDFFESLAPHYPGGSSVQSLLHFLQVGVRKKFAKYDYGNETNLELYNCTEPPLYDLDQVTMPIALFTAANDDFSTIADVEILRGQLPNVVYYLLNPRLLCNHVDFVWGRTSTTYLHPYMLTVLNKYNSL